MTDDDLITVVGNIHVFRSLRDSLQLEPPAYHGHHALGLWEHRLIGWKPMAHFKTNPRMGLAR